MNWISRLVPPKIKAWVKPEVPDNLWSKCPTCDQMIFHRELIKDLFVCRYCGYHMPLPASDRLKNIFDDGVFDLLPCPVVKQDPLSFRDGKKYVDRLKDAREQSGSDEAIMSAEGDIGGIRSICSVFNFKFIGGSMGAGVGEAIIKAVDMATEKSMPYIVFTSSGGARMQEGILSLMQMPRTVAAISGLRDKSLPYIVVLTNPTTGGVSASFAMIGDIHIAEPGAIIGFAGARVIKNTIKQELPDGFQTAEYLLDHGMIDMIVPRNQIKQELAKVLGLVCRH